MHGSQEKQFCPLGAPWKWGEGAFLVVNVPWSATGISGLGPGMLLAVLQCPERPPTSENCFAPNVGE